MDMIAEKLGIDPVELRLKNYRGLGETEPLSGDEIRSDGMKECLIKSFCSGILATSVTAANFGRVFISTGHSSIHSVPSK